jgi:hypothetical protein
VLEQRPELFIGMSLACFSAAIVVLEGAIGPLYPKSAPFPVLRAWTKRRKVGKKEASEICEWNSLSAGRT